MADKIQKILARSGLASRRQIEAFIREGRIKVDNEVAHIGQRIGESVRITFDGEPVQVIGEDIATEVLIYNKPAGELCTRDDPESRPTVFDNLPEPKQGRWINIGRLDINTSGLLLFTNDGELAHRLTHPSSRVEREYAVRVFGDVSDEILQNLTAGVVLDDGAARFEEIVSRPGGTHANRWFYVLVLAGRNRLVRRLWESQPGLQVSRLIRVRFGSVKLPPNIVGGRSEELSASEIKSLKKLAGIDTSEPSPQKNTRSMPRTKQKESARNKQKESVRNKQNQSARNKQKESAGTVKNCDSRRAKAGNQSRPAHRDRSKSTQASTSDKS